LDLNRNDLSLIPAQIENLVNLESLELDNNNFTLFPEEILNLHGLKYLYFFNNGLTSLPEGLDSLKYLSVSGNNLSFEDLEPLFLSPGQSKIDFFIYHNQHLIQVEGSLTVAENTTFELSSNIGGQYTHYDWQKNINSTWTSLGAPDDSVLTLTNVQLSDSGEYRCVATNDWITDLISYTKSFVVNVIEPLQYYAISSGSWNDPSIWSFTSGGFSANAVPSQWDKVTIDGYSITVDEDTQSGPIELLNQNPGTKLLVTNGTFKVFGEIHIKKVTGIGNRVNFNVEDAARLEVLQNN